MRASVGRLLTPTYTRLGGVAGGSQRRELYRRLARTGDDLVRVADRVWYAVLKES